MAIPIDTAEIQLDVVGQEAVQQTLDALLGSADRTNVAVESTAESSPGSIGAGGEGQAIPSLDFSGMMEAIGRTNEILERIAAAVEKEPPPPQTFPPPVY